MRGLIGFLIGVGALGMAWAEPGPRALVALRYRLTNNVFQEVGNLPGQRLSPLPQPGEILSSQPSYASDQPLYLKATLGQGPDPQYTLVLDASRGPGREYDTLYLDRNNDEALANEPPIRGYRREGATWFGPIPLLLTGQNGPYFYHLLCISRSQGSSNPTVELHSAGYYLGRASVGEGRHQLALVDANGNGLFNDFSTGPGEGDRVLIDLNDDGLFETGSEDSEEVYHLSAFLPVQDRYYTLTLPPEGGTLALAEVQPACGTLRSRSAPFWIQLSSEQGFFHFRSREPELRVPTGTYRLHACAVEARDAKGNVWKGIGRFPARRDLLIRRKETIFLDLGPPLKVEAVPQVQDDQVEFRLRITGGAGEEYQEIFKNGVRVPPPRLRIAEASGQQVGIYDFSYRRGGECTLLWRHPQRRSGRFTATVDFDVGPLSPGPGSTVSFEIKPLPRDLLQRRGNLK